MKFIKDGESKDIYGKVIGLGDDFDVLLRDYTTSNKKIAIYDEALDITLSEKLDEIKGYIPQASAIANAINGSTSIG